MNPRDLLESNRTHAALLRESEAELVARPIPLVDLRTVPRAAWDRCLHHDVTVPEAIARYLAGELTDGPPAVPLSREQVHAMEEQVEQFHGVTAPWHIAMSLGLQQTGRAWRFVPEAAPYLTGFALGKE